MIAGRLRWLAAGAKPPGKLAGGSSSAAVAGADRGGQQAAASLHLLARDALRWTRRHRRAVCDLAAFSQRLQAENHTLKRR